MLKTKGFHYDLLYTALEGEVFQAKLRNQLRFLKVREEEHTGTGLFVYFKEIAGMSKFKLSKQEIEKMDIGSAQQFTNIELINENLNILADVTIHLQNGIIDCLEIWNKTEADYPKEKLLKYGLKSIINK